MEVHPPRNIPASTFRTPSVVERVRRALQVQYREQGAPCWWDQGAQQASEIEYLYLTRDGYEKLQEHVLVHHIKTESGEDRFIFRDVVGLNTDNQVERKKESREDDHTRGCYNCLSQDHPPNKCLKNPVEGSPLFMQSAECKHCEQRGHVRSMCKAEGGACNGLPGIFPKGVSAVCTQPMVVTVAADATKDHDNVFPGSRGTKEVKAMRHACTKPKSEYELLQEKLHFAALRHSHDDFLILFGDKCERYKRKHHTASYVKEEVLVGFTTPIDSCYRPIGEARRKIQTRVRDLTKGMRFPPQTTKEQQERKRKAERSLHLQQQQQQQQQHHEEHEQDIEEDAEDTEETHAAVPGHDKSQRVHRRLRPRTLGLRTERDVRRGGDDESLPVSSQLKKLLELADRKSAGGERGCAEAVDELARKREKVKEKRREEVKEMVEARKQMKHEEQEAAVTRRPFTQQMFLQHFAFPKEELKESKHRVDKVKKGESYIQRLDEKSLAALLFPYPFMKVGARASDKLVPIKATEQDTQSRAASDADATKPRVRRPSTAPAKRRPSSASIDNDGTASAPGAPPSEAGEESQVIVNWRLRCVEEFNSADRPPPRVYGGVNENGTDMTVSGLNCGYWSFRFLSEQFKQQIRLQQQLERRKANRNKVYGNAEHLATLSQQASKQAVLWASSKACTPPESRHDLWTRAVRDKSLHVSELENKAAFYTKVLYCCDLASIPTAPPALHLLSFLRLQLVDVGDLSRSLLTNLTSALPADYLNDPEVGRILHFVKSELCVE